MSLVLLLKRMGNERSCFSTLYMKTGSIVLYVVAVAKGLLLE